MNPSNEYPKGTKPDSPMANLIDDINTALAERGQKLVWFHSRLRGGSIKVNAGVFRTDSPAKSVYHRDCISWLVDWVCLGGEIREHHLQSLKEAWAFNESIVRAYQKRHARLSQGVTS